MKLRTKADNSLKEALFGEIIEQHKGKGRNATHADLRGKHDEDREHIDTKVEQLIREKKVFRYRGELYPWKELDSLYDGISAEVLRLVQEWEQYRSEPLDPVHIWDNEKEYYANPDKLNISWEALLRILELMKLRGAVDCED